MTVQTFSSSYSQWDQNMSTYRKMSLHNNILIVWLNSVEKKTVNLRKMINLLPQLAQIWLNLAPVIIRHMLLFLHAIKGLVNIHWTGTALTTKLHSTQFVGHIQGVISVVFGEVISSWCFQFLSLQLKIHKKWLVLGECFLLKNAGVVEFHWIKGNTSTLVLSFEAFHL